MKGEALWNKVLTELSSEGEELQTRTGLWFRALVKGSNLFIDRAIEHAPSSNLSMARNITKNDFLFVYSYYDRWVKGEKGVRQRLAKNLDRFAG